MLCIDPAMGMAGDMFAAALLDLGAPEERIVDAMMYAGSLLGARVRVDPVRETRHEVSGVHLRLELRERTPVLEASRARALIENAADHEGLAPPYAEFARRALEELLEAEREAHTGPAGAGEIRMKPIGRVRTPYRHTAPYQPSPASRGEFRVELFPGFAAGLEKIGTFSHLYILSFLDRSRGWSATVTPPWQEGARPRRVGVFASRSPNRPNPIGLTVVEVRGVDGNRILTGPMDLFDGTPVLDVKPFIRSLEPAPEETGGNDGWLAGTDHLRLHREGVPHRHSGEQAVLHEAADILLDVMAAAVGLQALGLPAEKAVCLTPVAVGGGTVSCSHGRLPVPPPAVAALLKRRRIPHVSGPVEVELLTPTGAAILAALRPVFRARELGPPESPEGSGRGFGSRRLEAPNVLTLHRIAASFHTRSMQSP